MMKGFLTLVVLGTCGCEREGRESAAPPPVETVTPTQAPASKPPALIPKPEDQAELDRLILAGYTPHADHLHAPGVNECPLTKGSEAVM